MSVLKKCPSYGGNVQRKPSVGTSISVRLREVSVSWGVRLERFYCIGVVDFFAPFELLKFVDVKN